MSVISGSTPAYRDGIAGSPREERGEPDRAVTDRAVADRAVDASSTTTHAAHLLSAARLRVCLIAPSFYGWGHYSGPGRVTRMLGRELARRGARVTAIVPRQHGQREVEQVDGVTVLGYPAGSPWHALKLSRDCDADIYHSQGPTVATLLAAVARPRRRHVMTLRDAPSLSDFGRSLRSLIPGRAHAVLPLLRDEHPLRWLGAVPANAVYCSAEDLVALARARLHRRTAGFLPAPVSVPRRVQKSRVPTVCFLGSWAPHRHPERVLALAARFPTVRIIAIGRSPDRAHDFELRRTFARYANLYAPGPVNQFRSDALSQTLSESWVLVSTGGGRGLPDACVEGAAHACAILSDADPDAFATRFGHYAATGDLAEGLEALLAGNAWRELGARGHAHVLATFDAEVALRRHLDAYDDVLA